MLDAFSGWYGELEWWFVKGISGLLVDGLVKLANIFFYCISATKKPAQHCNLVSGLQASIFKV